jgi:hypothetical protein
MLEHTVRVTPCLHNGFSGLLLEVRNFATKKIGFTDGEELDEEVV